MKNDNIFALATPFGYSALALIRVSGNKCLEKIPEFFKFHNDKITINTILSHKSYFGYVFDDKGIIDECLLTIFKAPHSYTKEDSFEISFHGSPYIIKRISNALVNVGFSLAGPGEFTMRAFMNGRFDLSQAEAVIDLITSHSDTSHALAMKQFRGEFSQKINQLRQQLIDFISLIELELDFSEEDVEFADNTKLINILTNHINEINLLIQSFKQGNVIKQGIPVTIVGRPNAGKSTLLNAILKDDKAIVSEIPGTTRDTIEDIVTIDGVSFRFIDTAGLRNTTDHVEMLGIERTLKKIEQAEVVLYIADLTNTTIDEIFQDIEEFKQNIPDFNKKKLIILGNKTDLLIEIPHGFKQLIDYEVVFISAKRNENIHLVENLLKEYAQNYSIEDNFFITNTRHYEALIRTKNSLERVLDGLEKNLTKDFLTIDLREAAFQLGSITGQVTTDDILDNIFRNFCIGK